MWACASHCASDSDVRGRLRPVFRAWIAAVLLASALTVPSAAEAYRRGLDSWLGGATLDDGHVLWFIAGYPSLSLGWGVAVHPRIDLGVLALVAYSDPAHLGESLVGGGGGLRVRFGLIRGRLSLSAIVDLNATAYTEARGTAALLHLGSPTLALSIRLADRVALHVSIRAVIQYVTAPAELIGGVEGAGGVTIGLTRRFALLASVSYGTTLGAPHSPGAGRLEALIGLEYRLGIE